MLLASVVDSLILLVCEVDTDLEPRQEGSSMIFVTIAAHIDEGETGMRHESALIAQMQYK